MGKTTCGFAADPLSELLQMLAAAGLLMARPPVPSANDPVTRRPRMGKHEESGSHSAPALGKRVGQSARAAIIAAVERCSAVSVGWLVS